MSRYVNRQHPESIPGGNDDQAAILYWLLQRVNPNAEVSLVSGNIQENSHYGEGMRLRPLAYWVEVDGQLFSTDQNLVSPRHLVKVRYKRGGRADIDKNVLYVRERMARR